MSQRPTNGSACNGHPLLVKSIETRALIEDTRLDIVSCAPRVLYREGGLYEDLVAQHDPKISRQCQFRMISEIYPPYRVARPEPDLVLTGNLAFYESLLAEFKAHNKNYDRGAASALVSIADASLFSNVLYDISPAKFRVVFETWRRNDRPYVPTMDAAFIKAAPIEFSDPNVLYVFVGSCGSFNYGHWLVDDLPKLKAVPILRNIAGKKPIQIIITSYGDPIDQVRLESVRLLCRGLSGIEPVLVRPDQVCHFKTLYYITPVSYHPVLKNPEALNFLVKATMDKKRIQPAPLRLFVIRGAGLDRQLTNLAAVQFFLAAKGFSAIDCAKLSFAEQANLFARAEIVVGCVGAAMTNSLFASTGTPVVYLSPEGWTEPFYWDLAAMRGHPYFVCIGPAMGRPSAVHQNSYTIDIAALDQILRHALNCLNAQYVAISMTRGIWRSASMKVKRFINKTARN